MTLPNQDTPLKIGTRGSPLALAQAEETRDRLMTAHGLPAEAFEIIVIKTTGDQVQDRALSEIGGKGLFTKEIEEAMLAGSIDIAVHSMKDMPVEQPGGLVLDTYLPREDVRDAFVSLKVGAIDDLAQGAVVGTSSLRRRAQLAHKRPDLEIVEFRGNVQTRMRKLADGVASATFLACAGLARLGTEDPMIRPIPTETMLPAVAQGASGIERRQNDDATAELLGAIHHLPTGQRLAADLHGAFAGHIQPAEQIEQRGFTRPGSADDGGDVAPADGQFHTVEHLQLATAFRVALDQPAGLQHRLLVFTVTHSAGPPRVAPGWHARRDTAWPRN